MEGEVKPLAGTRSTAFRWTFGSIRFDEATWTLHCGDEVVEIERRPLEVLSCLLRHAGEVVTRDELLDAAWSGRVVIEGALTNAIGKLRQAIGDEEKRLIATVPRVGYRFLGKVERRVIERGAIGTQFVAGDAMPRRPHWRLLRALDLSGAGEVWLAEHDKTHESRVFKFSFDGSRLGALKREATISRLLHDSLGDRTDFVRVIDWDFGDAPYFIESEYGGPSLEEWVSARGNFDSVPLSVRLEWMAELADAVACAHDVGVLHKDLKPANVLVSEDKSRIHPRIVDFGSGRILDPSQLDALGITKLGFTQTNTSSDSLTGTPLYLAPELLSGHVPTVRSDIYALGVMLFQLCVGDLRRPLSAGWEQEIDSPLLRDDIARSAAGNPDLRLDSARVLATRLRSMDQRMQEQQHGEAERIKALAVERQLAKARTRRPWVIAAVVALLVGLVISTTLYLQTRIANTRAESEIRITTAMNDFLNQDVLRQADTDVGGSVKLGLTDIIHHAAKEIDAKFANDHEIAARLL